MSELEQPNKRTKMDLVEVTDSTSSSISTTEEKEEKTTAKMETKEEEDLKRCRYCSRFIQGDITIQRFPESYDITKLSNIIMCDKRCIRRYLAGHKKAYLLTVYSYYLLMTIGFPTDVESATDVERLIIHQINPTKDSITLEEFHGLPRPESHLIPWNYKQCINCFDTVPFDPNQKDKIATYILKTEYGLPVKGNLVFCDYSCVNRYIRPLESNFSSLLADFRRNKFEDNSDSFSMDVERLKCFNIVTENRPELVSYNYFHKTPMLPKPISTDLFYTNHVTRKPIPHDPPIIDIDDDDDDEEEEKEEENTNNKEQQTLPDTRESEKNKEAENEDEEEEEDYPMQTIFNFES